MTHFFAQLEVSQNPQMPKKIPSVLNKVSNFVKIPIYSLAKMRNPITSNLILFFKKKSGKVKFYRHYNDGFVQEYQFSPSNTPSLSLIFPHRKQCLSKQRKSRKLQSIMFMCMCLGNYGVQEKEEIYSSKSSMELMPESCMKNGVISGEEEGLEMLEIGNDECGLLSVDERAERFIHKFYAQMRMQCHDSTNQLSPLLAD